MFTLALGSAACGGSGDSVTESGGGTTSQALGGVQSQVFDKSCSTVGCHRGTSAAGGLTLEKGKARGAMVNVAAAIAPGKVLVVPGDPDQSFLMAKLRGHLGENEGVGMPYGQSPLPDADLALVERWIRAGAPAE